MFLAALLDDFICAEALEGDTRIKHSFLEARSHGFVITWKTITCNLYEMSYIAWLAVADQRRTKAVRSRCMGNHKIINVLKEA